MTVIRALALGWLLAGTPLALPAQRWQTLTAERQRHDTDSLRVRVRYGAGTFTLGAAPESLLYTIRAHYDAQRFQPTRSYDTATHTLTVGLGGSAARPFALDLHQIHVGDQDGERPSTLTLGLATGVPVDLDLTLGASRASLDLANLSLSRLRLEAAATESRLTFGTPNTARLSELAMSVMAASVTVEQLANARAERVSVTSRAGSVELDLSGDWQGDLELDLHLVLSGAVIRVPRDVGVQARVSRFLGDLDAPGMTERGGTFYSANWAKARRRLTLTGDLTLAGIELVPID
jgi:hypothetical protein